MSGEVREGTEVTVSLLRPVRLSEVEDWVAAVLRATDLSSDLIDIKTSHMGIDATVAIDSLPVGRES